MAVRLVAATRLGRRLRFPPVGPAHVCRLPMVFKVMKVSVVLPLRNAQHRILAEVEAILDVLVDLSREPSEVIVVDDGSSDATSEVLQELTTRFPQVRIARHSRPRGLEAAGQTGLEKATGEIVFIQENNRPLRLEDLRRLFRMAEDDTILAARAESTPRPLSGPLQRRLQAWGARAAEALRRQPLRLEPSGLQMIRRPHLQQLAASGGVGVGLQSDVFDFTTVS